MPDASNPETMKFHVVLPDRVPGDISSLAHAMATAFEISDRKAETLLRRAPGPLTKPLEERRAVRVAAELRKLGLSVKVEPVEERLDSKLAASSPPTASTPPAPQARYRSPFLSQVDEAPSPVPDAPPMPAPYRPADSSEAPQDATPKHDSPQNHGPRSDTSRGHSYGDEAPRAATVFSRRQGRSPFASQLIVAAVLPGLIALLGAWLTYALIDDGAPDPVLASVAASSAEMLSVAIGGRDPSETGPRAEMREALLGAQGSLQDRGVGLMAVTSLEGTLLAGWERGDAVLEPDALSIAEGLGDLIGNAADAPGPVLANVGDSADRLRVAASAIRVRGEPVAAVVVGATAAFPVDAFSASLLTAFVLLGLGAAVAWLASRGLVREQQRLQDETERISRGDLGRPVGHSERFPETVQALERIRVSLQEGLERLRRRKR